MNEDAEFAQLREAIVARFPEFAAARFDVHTKGFDSIALEAQGTIFKFPRNAAAEASLRMEAGLLGVVSPAVTMRVPSLSIVEGRPLFSKHEKIPGDHLEAEQYEALAEPAKNHLAEELAQFYAELHALDRESMKAAGAREIGNWGAPEKILREAWPLLPGDLRGYAERVVSAYASLPPDPLGKTYGFFDGHGWNMAFEHAKARLNGVYDFGDSGFGDVQQEFMYTDWIAPDLTDRVIAEYGKLTGRMIDRARVSLLTAVIRLAELGGFAGQPDRIEWALGFVREWKAYQESGGPLTHPPSARR